MPCTPTETDNKDMMIQPSSWYALVVLIVAQKCLLIGMACSMAMLLGRELIVLDDNNDNDELRNIINKDYANGNDRPKAFGLFLSTPPWYHDGDDDNDDTTTPWIQAQRLVLTTVVVSFGCLVWLLTICCIPQYNNHHHLIRYVMAGMMGMGLPLLQGTAVFLVLHNDDDTATTTTTTVGTTTSYHLGTSGKCGIAACVWFAVAGVLCFLLGDLSQPTTSWHGTTRSMNRNDNDDKWEQDTTITISSNDMSLQQDSLDNDQVDAMTP